MPHNTQAFEVAQYTLAKSKWEKGSDKLYRPQFKPAEVTLIMQGLDTKSGEIFKRVVSCLSALNQEHME